MSRHTDALSRAHTSIDQALQVVGRLHLVDVAAQRSEAWMATQAPPGQLGEIGGSSSPSEIEEADERRRVTAQASRDVVRIPELCKMLDLLAHELYRIVQRVSTTIDPEKYPSDPVPGCRSCARDNGHWEALYEKAKSVGLCRWCYDHAKGEVMPALGAVEVLHREGPNRASAWMSRRRCASELTRGAVSVRCVLAPGHVCDHEVLVGGEKVVWPQSRQRSA